MHKIRAFALRNGKEILRDPLSYVFCLGFPLVMLAIMTLVDQSIPPQASMTLFHIDNLTGGILIFGQTFVMLFTAITVAKDRSSTFLLRMYATPMTAMDFVLGYMLPMLALSLAQGILIGLCGFIVSLLTGTALSLSGLLLALLPLIPSAMVFIGFGLLFGTLFREKAAPGVCSIIISLGSFLGSIWFDAESAGGVLLTISRYLPFHYCTKAARTAIHRQTDWESFFLPLIIIVGCAMLLCLLSAFVFKQKMKADLN